MDHGDWLFYGIVALSVIGSLVKSLKKKREKVQEGEKSEQKKDTVETWVRTIIENTTQMNLDDDFIPKNPKPAVPTQPASQPTPRAAQSGRMPDAKSNPESYRRPNLSSETFRRPNKSLEDISVIEGNEAGGPGKRSGSATHTTAAAVVTSAEACFLKPEEDLKQIEDVKRAIIYGEIFRPKF